MANNQQKSQASNSAASASQLGQTVKVEGQKPVEGTTIQEGKRTSDEPLAIRTEVDIEKGTADYAIGQIMRELPSVYQGGSVQLLLSIVSDVYPNDQKEAARYLSMLRRLRDATEAVERQAIAESARR